MPPISKRRSNCCCSQEFRTGDQRLSRQECVCGRSRASCGVLLPSSLTEERTQRRHDSCGNRKRHSEQRPPRSSGLISKPTHKRLHPPQHISPASRTNWPLQTPLILLGVRITRIPIGCTKFSRLQSPARTTLFLLSRISVSTPRASKHGLTPTRIERESFYFFPIDCCACGRQLRRFGPRSPKSRFGRPSACPVFAYAMSSRRSADQPVLYPRRGV